MGAKVKIDGIPALPFAMEEEMNRLRINVGFAGSKVKKILVISTEPNEGKSFVAMHLWDHMGRLGNPSVLVDADLRKSVMIDHYKIRREDGKPIRGTSHYLAEDYSLEDAVLHTDIPGRDLLPNADEVINPAILIESDRFSEMLDELAGKYRYVFVDAPPLGLVSDGESIAAQCDGAILVVRSGVTSKKAVRTSLQQLERSGCRFLGFVLNRVGSSKDAYYKKGYGHYGKYGSYGAYGRYGSYGTREDKESSKDKTAGKGAAAGHGSRHKNKAKSRSK